MKKQRKGFTTVELVIVIAVIAILATVLIPTFAGIIRKAHHNSDVQMASNLTTQIKMYLVNKDIKTESDLRDAINENMGEGFYEGIDEKAGLTPESAQYGYHFWYDIEKEEIIVATVEEIDEIVEERKQQVFAYDNILLSAAPSVPNSTWTESTAHFRHYEKDAYHFFMLDRGGSEIGKAFAKLDELNGGTNKYGDVLTVLASLKDIDGHDKAFAARAFAAFEKTAVVAYGTFVKDAETTIENVYISLRVTELSATETVINNTAGITVTLPSNVAKINSYSLQFSAEANLNINAEEDSLSTLLGADSISSNCMISLSGKPGYTVNGETVIGPDDFALSLNFSESSVVSDLALTGSALTQNKIALVPNADGGYNLYVAVDYANSITLSVADYFDAAGEKIIAAGTKWSAADGVECLDAKNGTFKVNSFADDRTALAGTITAKIQGVTKTVTVYGVKATGITVDLSGNEGLNIREVDQNNTTITLPYTPGDPNNKWNFKPSVVLNYPNADITLDGSISVSDSANALGFTEGVLSLKSAFNNNANTSMSVAFGKADETPIATSNITYTIKLINTANKSFGVDGNVTTGTYSKLLNYYIGNAGAFKIDYLFDVLEGKNISGQIILVKVSQGGTPIGTYKFSDLNGEFNPSQLTTLNQNYKIEIGLGVEVLNNNGTPDNADDDYYVAELVGATTDITVHLVAGRNITADTAQANIPSSSSSNIVLLSDISLTSVKTFNNVYGNLHKINASPSGKTNGYWVGFITLHGTMRDTLVLGPVYESVGFYDEIINAGGARAWDGVAPKGTAKVIDSYLFGFRAPVQIISATDVQFINTTIEGGTYCNIHMVGAKVTLDGCTLIQDKAGYISTEKSSTSVYGMSIFCDTAATGTVVLKNNTVQYNWISVEDANKISSTNSAQGISLSVTDIITRMVEDSAGFVHNYVDGAGKTIQYVNLGIIQEINVVNYGCDDEHDEANVTVNSSGNSKQLTPGERIVYDLGLIGGTKHYDGWSYAPSAGGGTVTNADFLPAGWTSQRNNNYLNFLNGKK